MISNTNDVYKELEGNLKKNISHTYNEFTKLRAGKASPNIFDSVMVDYYGAATAMASVASVSAPDARSIVIQPWEKNMIQPIETAIINANLGFAPSNDGHVIRINIPPLTEERRKDLAKQVKAETELSKIGIRNLRKEALEQVKKLKNDGLSEDEAKGADIKIQKMIDDTIAQLETMQIDKEKEIMTV